MLALIALGDRSAFLLFYELFERPVFFLVRSILIDWALSEEVAQEVHLEVWRGAANFSEAQGTATAWVLTLARRRAIDCVRSTEASRRRDVRVGRRDFEPSYDTVWDDVETRVGHLHVVNAMRGLTDIQREAITLNYTLGYSAVEIAEILDIPHSTVKTRLRDALIRLRQEFSVTWPDDAAIDGAAPHNSRSD